MRVDQVDSFLGDLAWLLCCETIRHFVRGGVSQWYELDCLILKSEGRQAGQVELVELMMDTREVQPSQV